MLISAYLRRFILAVGLTALGVSGAARAENLHHCSLGQSAFNARDFVTSVRQYTQCIETGNLRPPVLAVAYRERGMARARSDEPLPAYEDFTRSLSINPRDAEVWFERALILYKSRAYPEAVNDLTQAIAVDSRQAQFYSLRGLTYEKIGKPEQGLRDFRQSYTLGVRVREMITKLQSNNILAGFRGSPEIRMLLPDGFVDVNRSGDSTQRIVQYVPRGESVGNWSQMVTLHSASIPQGYLQEHGRSAHLKIATDLKDRVLNEYLAVCDKAVRPADNTVMTGNGEFIYVEGTGFCDGADTSRVPSHIHVRKNGFIATRVYARGNGYISFQYEWQSNEKPSRHVVESGLERYVLKELFPTIELSGVTRRN